MHIDCSWIISSGCLIWWFMSFFMVVVFLANHNIDNTFWKLCIVFNHGHKKISNWSWDQFNQLDNWEWVDWSRLWQSKLDATEFCLPWKCNKCFFCKNVFCGGIYHLPEKITVIHHVDGTKKMVGRCTDIPVCLFDCSFCCIMCYRNANEDAKGRKEKLENSTFGCLKYKIISVIVSGIKVMICIVNDCSCRFPSYVPSTLPASIPWNGFHWKPCNSGKNLCHNTVHT